VTRAYRIAAGSIALGVVVLGLKSAAWAVTGSAALFSDAAESVVNVAAACIAFGALRFADRPADANHPYGHDKAEFFAAVVEGVLILAAALLILEHAWNVWRDPEPLRAPVLGLVLNALSTVLNACWAWVLLGAGRTHRSAALRADGKHLLSDVVTSIGVVIGVTLVFETGLAWLDPVLAAATGAYIIYAGLHVIGESVGGLMDAAPAEAIIASVRRLVGEHAAGALEAHDLRMRQAGRHAFLEFHLVVPAAMTVADAHEICDRIEEALRAEVPGLLITIHVEPEGKAKHHGVIVL
jgi:cation diffusion facilitator family transporter